MNRYHTVEEITAEGYFAWAERFRRRWGHSAFEIINTVENPEPAALAEAWGIFELHARLIPLGFFNHELFDE